MCLLQHGMVLMETESLYLYIMVYAEKFYVAIE